MGFSSYFLIVWDFVKYARDHGIPVGPGRGSAVGSLVAYCLRITDLDPLRFRLLFERFLNPERISMPDIDTDFCVERRDEVIAYVTQKYGKDRVAQIVTFGTMAARAAIRDAGRALGVPLPDVDRIAKLFPSGPGGYPDRASDRSDRRAEDDVRHAARRAQATRHGRSRSRGWRAMRARTPPGVVISAGPLMEYTPLVRFGDGGINTQYDMDWIERIGLLKMDFLGLRNLTVMDKAVAEIRRTVDADFDLTTIPFDDARTYAHALPRRDDGRLPARIRGNEARLRRAAAVRASRTSSRWSRSIGPDRWIGYRSTSAASTAASKPQYLHPKLEPILAETYGIPVYQEQVMQMAREIAGFTMTEADELRKVIGEEAEGEGSRRTKRSSSTARRRRRASTAR